MRAVHDVGKKICLERFYGLTDCHTSEKPTDTRSCGWILPPTPPLQHCHRLIQDCGQNTEDHDGHDHEIQLEDLAAVDDEEAKACLGGEKLADDDADDGLFHIYFSACHTIVRCLE